MATVKKEIVINEPTSAIEALIYGVNKGLRAGVFDFTEVEYFLRAIRFFHPSYAIPTENVEVPDEVEPDEILQEDVDDDVEADDTEPEDEI